MCRNDEILIHKRIQELNNILEKDEKNGELSTLEFNNLWFELHQLEQNLRLIYIKRFLKEKKNTVELNLSLLHQSDEESDSNLEECYEHNIANIFPFYKKNESLQI